MTQKDFLTRMTLLARACDYRLDETMLSLYDRALKRFGYDRATAAIEEAIIERRGNERMPSIGDLVQRCCPSVIDADSAVEVAGRIWTAISRFGQYRAIDAASWIGEVGWYVVEHSGGWEKICQTAQAKDVGVWKAQLRDHAAASLRRHKAGVLGAAPTFGELSKGQEKMTALIGSVLNGSTLNGSTGNAGNLSPAPGSRQLESEINS